MLGMAVVITGLIWTHVVVQNARGPLPLMADVLDLAKAGDVPVRVSVIETARQRMPRANVLDASRDPSPGAPYVMTFPAFVLEWADGRLLLIDAGMSRRRAAEFGAILTRFAGADPIEPGVSVGEALGEAASRVGGIVFTHLHVDHVEGLRELCDKAGHRIKVFMSALQYDQWTFTTAEGMTIVEESGCAERIRLGEPRFQMLDGFPGVAVIPAGGHTPGSELIVAAVRDATGTVRRFAFIGDIANAIDGVRGDVPKPLLYRLLIIPEDDDRLGELRRYARSLEREHGFVVVPSHDGDHLKSLDLPAWGARP